MHNSSYNGNTKRIQKLLDDNADINITTRNQYQDSPLHKAVAGGNIDAIQLLIDSRAEIDQKNKTGQTPGHYAAYHCNPSIITALLKAKADPMAREDEYGDDWLHKVASSDKANNPTKKEIFVLLKDCGVTMVQNDDHKTAIDYANNDQELIGMLKEVFEGSQEG